MKFVVIISAAFALTVQSAYGQMITTYYDLDSSLIKEEYEVNNLEEFQLNGVYKSYYYSGKLKSIGKYSNNKPDGLWKYYYENGGIKTKGQLREGITTGHWQYYYENGSMRMEGELKANKREGEWIFYYENGTEKSRGTYENNAKNGIWNYFYEDSNLKAQAFYENNSGLYKEFYPSGALKMEGYNSNQRSTGKWKYYYETGELQAEGYFRMGAKHGPWKYYHKNGIVSATGGYTEGQKEGLWKYYYEDGKLSSEGIESNGLKEGVWKLYYETGQIKAEGKFDKGSGTFLEFYENGKQKAKGNVLRGKNEGKWIYFNEAGNEEGYALFRRGEGTYKGFYEDGTLKMEGKIKDGKRVGEWKLYNPDGSLAGYYKPIYEDDKPIFRTRESFTRNAQYDKPEYQQEKEKSRYFKPVVNEYKAYIIGSNPIFSIGGWVPIALEFYTQERLGYEVVGTVIRQPFFKNGSGLGLDENFKSGAEFSLRQKFYSPDRQTGMYYFGHQLTITSVTHGKNIMNTAGTNQISINAQENTFTYDVYIGNRWMNNPGDAGFTWDAFLGVGLGYRDFQERYDTVEYTDQYFDHVRKSKIHFPIRFGLNFGYAGPKKKNTTY